MGMSLDDDDYLPDFLKEDSVVESPFGLDDMVMPSDYEWPYLIDDFSVENILKLNDEGKNPNNTLTGSQWRALGKIKDNLYNWDNEPGFSDIFHKEFCKKYDISLSVLKALEKKGLIKLSKDDYYFKERGYIVYPKPLMYLVYISEQDYPDWFIPEAKEKGLWKAESKKINPIEKAGISGVASGATIEGLSALMAAEESIYGAETFEAKGGKRMYCPNCKTNRTWNQGFKKNTMDYSKGEKPSDFRFYVCQKCDYAYDPKTGKKMDDNWKERFGYDAETFEAQGKPTWAGYCPFCKKWRTNEWSKQDGKDRLCGKRVPDYHTDAGEWAYFYREKFAREGGNWAEPNENICGVVLDKKQSKNAETFEAAEEQLSAYFARLKDQNPDLAKKIEYSIKDESYLPTVEITNAGFDDEIIEAWVDLVGVEDENLQPYESCSTCEGEGYVLTSYTSATRFDPADGDGEDCEECGGTGMIDPSDYMDKDGNYMAESFEAAEWVGFCPECNKWRTKEMSVKIDSKINTTGWSIPDKLLGKRLCKKSQRFGKIRQSGDTFTGYGSRGFDDSYCGTPLTKVKSKYKAEAESCPNCKTNSEYICDSCIQCKGCCETSYGCYEIALCNDCDGSFIGKDIEGCCGSCDDCCECDQDPSMNAEEKESMNPYLLGAGIFALTLGILSRKL